MVILTAEDAHDEFMNLTGLIGDAVLQMMKNCDFESVPKLISLNYIDINFEKKNNRKISFKYLIEMKKKQVPSLTTSIFSKR